MRAFRYSAVAVVVASSATPIHARDVWTLCRQATEAFLHNADLSDFQDAGEGDEPTNGARCSRRPFMSVAPHLRRTGRGQHQIRFIS